ncbi:MAG: hypothetical protein ACYDAS_04175 [Patescibacteria group bacterium]
MKTNIRKLVKNILVFLTNKIIKKNDIKLVSVFGNYSSDVAVEGIYHVFKENGYKVRRNYVSFEKDIDIPIYILTNRENFSLLNFILALFKFPILYLHLDAFQKQCKNSYVILDLTTYSPSVVKYYSRFIHSDICVFLDITQKSLIYQNKIIEDSKNSAKIIIDGDSKLKSSLNYDISKKVFSFGKGVHNSLIYQNHDDLIHISYNEDVFELKNTYKESGSIGGGAKDLDSKIIASIALISLEAGISFHSVMAGLASFRLPHRGFQKVFEKFVK